MVTIFIPNKPSTAAGTVDGDGTQTYQWLVPLNECGVVASQDTTDPANVNNFVNFTKYDLYWNSNRKVLKKISSVFFNRIGERMRSFWKLIPVVLIL